MKYPVFSLLLAFIFLSTSAQGQNRRKEWTLVHQEDGRVKTLKKGQNLVLKWRGLSGVVTLEGRLVDFTADSMTLSFKNKIGCYANQDILEMRVRKSGWGVKLLSAVLLLAGVFLAGFFSLGQIAYNVSRTDFQLASGEQKAYWPWAILGIGLIVMAFVVLKDNSRQTSRSFGRDWRFQEIPGQTKNMP